MAEPQQRPPWYSNAWAAWSYRLMMWGGAVAAAGFAIWLVHIIAYDPWTPDTQAQRIDILGKALFGFIGCLAVTTTGLVVRNLVRNAKGSVGLVTFEMSSHDPQQNVK